MPQPRTPPTLNDYIAAQLEWSAYSDGFWAGEDTSVSVNNRLAKRAGALLEELRQLPDWPDTLEAMAASEEPAVRMMAAHQFYETDSERALAIFAEIEHGPYGRLSRDAYWAAEGHKSRPAGTPQVPRRNVEVPAHPAEFDPERERIAEAVLTVHAAIMNGGFLSAFDVAGHAIPDAIHGYVQIGLDQVAVLLQAGAALFPGGIVPQDPAERQRLVDDVIDARALEELGTAYDDLLPDDELLNDKLDGFIDGSVNG